MVCNFAVRLKVCNFVSCEKLNKQAQRYMAEDKNIDNREDVRYDSNDIMTLDWNEHVRLRPGMYIGKLGDGTHDDDGIYVILKEVLDNSIDEYAMGYGKHRARRGKPEMRQPGIPRGSDAVNRRDGGADGMASGSIPEDRCGNRCQTESGELAEGAWHIT